jgi:uncharacterized protein YndB with AHSA1/START domain
MTDSRTHSASRIIIASPRAIFRALIDPESILCWRPPNGMSAKIFTFNARRGGHYRMAFIYSDPDHAQPKSSDAADIFQGTFVELIPDEKIVEAVEFESEDPKYQGTMTITTTLVPVQGGTKVSFLAENVPPGISEADHKAGMDSTLKKLANFLE